MAQPPLSFHKVLALPADPVDDGIYFVRDGDKMRLVVIASDGTPVPLEAHAPRFMATFPVGDQWIVNHNLGAKPAGIRLLTVGGVEFDAHIVHTSDNQFVVSVQPALGGQVVVQ